GGDDRFSTGEVFNDGIGQAFALEMGGQQTDVELLDENLRAGVLAGEDDPLPFLICEGLSDGIDGGAFADEDEAEGFGGAGAEHTYRGQGLQPAFLLDSPGYHAEGERAVW